jgi:Xaa-Pro aminopeptidase
MDERLARTMAALREIKADWVVLSAPDSVAYALGYAPPLDWGPSPFAAGPNLALVGRDESAGLLALEGEPATAREGLMVRYDGYGHLPAHPPDVLYVDGFKHLIKRLGVSGSVAVEPGTLPAIIEAALPTTRRDGFAPVFRRQRMTKTADEIDALRHAAEVSAAGQRQFLNCLRPGITELQLFSEIRSAMEGAAGERLAVAGDLVSGRARTAGAWGRPCRRMIETGDAVLCDLAPRVGAYWGDSCATAVLGSANEKQSSLFRAAKRALELAIAELRPGITAERAHRIVHDSVHQASFDYSHHTGHGIGTAVHEHPRLAEGETEVLRAGMVLMVEPGAYHPEIGGARTEFMLQITETGCSPLAEFPLLSSVAS